MPDLGRSPDSMDERSAGLHTRLPFCLFFLNFPNLRIGPRAEDKKPYASMRVSNSAYAPGTKCRQHVSGFREIGCGRARDRWCAILGDMGDLGEAGVL